MPCGVCAYSDLNPVNSKWTHTNSCIVYIWIHRYRMCMRIYWPGSLADWALGVICSSSCAWRECYSKAWLWNALFKHYKLTHTLYYVPVTCWLNTSGRDKIMSFIYVHSNVLLWLIYAVYENSTHAYEWLSTVILKTHRGTRALIFFYHNCPRQICIIWCTFPLISFWLMPY